MGVEQLQIIAEILGGLEAAGVKGFIWFLVADIVKALLPFIAIIVLLIFGFVLLKRLIGISKINGWLLNIGNDLQADVSEPIGQTDYKKIRRKIAWNQEEYIRTEEKEKITKDRLRTLQGEYEKLWAEFDAQKETIRLQDAAITELTDRRCHSDTDSETDS